MPKIKLPTQSPHIDMTPMVDLFSVVLIFLMLTTTMRQPEPATVDTPFSISETPTPDFNTMTFLLSADGKVYMNFDNGPDTLLKYRPKILDEMGKRYEIEFTDEERRAFEKYKSAMGVPITRMKEFLTTNDNNLRNSIQENGIPIDSADNQLAMWILCARQVNPNIQASIKGDSNTEFSVVEKVLDILQDKNVNRFNLVTSLEAAKINLEEIQQ
ncbi:MAG TPA: biopolymer transporter ExbD [Bacteroidales bacterium]|nr:biopolymer transporter ExbD [Bacteroidales bacterium]HPF03239.1 biopolymer transporter ExbD [Bacteroidales bacterium]HPJ59525.1 biopolymer transporter ExbD [Bacteroidales bacterium]HPR12062.1 biopolymer transporter ExbD [Bacteroidales bacterium]HRW86687.1 biopolymer transporter ExbD [Bacteroidales bacterium]